MPGSRELPRAQVALASSASALHMPILTLDEAKVKLPRQPCGLPEKVEASTSTLWLILDRECSAPTLEEVKKSRGGKRQHS